MKFYTTGILLFALLFGSTNIMAQKNDASEYYDLLMYYLDGDFEKLQKKSEKYMDSDKSKRDPLPYLYASMMYYDLSLDSERAAEFDEKRPLREALKLGTKFVRYDRSNAYYEDGKDYMEKLRTAIKQEAAKELADGSDSKAQYYYKQLLRMDEQDYSIIYQQMFLAVQEGDTYTANEMRGQFTQIVSNVRNWEEEPLHRKDLLKSAMLDHAKYLAEKGRSDAAKKTIAELEKYLGSSPESKALSARL